VDSGQLEELAKGVKHGNGSQKTSASEKQTDIESLPRKNYCARESQGLVACSATRPGRLQQKRDISGI
jgi:hypothetical protein